MRYFHSSVAFLGLLITVQAALMGSMRRLMTGGPSLEPAQPVALNTAENPAVVEKQTISVSAQVQTQVAAKTEAVEAIATGEATVAGEAEAAGEAAAAVEVDVAGKAQ